MPRWVAPRRVRRSSAAALSPFRLTLVQLAREPLGPGACGPRCQLRRADAIAVKYQTELEQERRDRQLTSAERERLQTGLERAQRDLADLQVGPYARPAACGACVLKAAVRARPKARPAKRALVRQDKLATTERSYSAQLTMMTEHIFSLNTQIQEQQQELERRPPAAAARVANANPSPRRKPA